MYKFLVLAAVLAYAHAGLLGAPIATTYAAGPAIAYGHAALPAVSTAIGTSQQATVRSLDGGNVVSQYSKAVDSAFSSVRKYDTRITNDARYLAATPVLAARTIAAPAIAHAPLGYAASPLLARSAIAAPVAAHAGLVGVAYSAAPAVSHIAFDGLGAHYAW